MPPSLRVLVVEDRVIMASAFAFLLEQWGHTVQIAYNARAALSMAGSFVPDVVLLDLDLTNTDVPEVARRVRLQRWPGQVLLIALSSSPMFAGPPDSGDDLFAHYLANPFDPSLLQEVLCRWAWQSRRASASTQAPAPRMAEANAFPMMAGCV